MSVFTFKSLINQAKTCKTNVKKKYKLDMTDKWSYYFAKAILNPKKDIKKIKFDNNPSPIQDKINTKASKSEYKDLAEKLIKFVESEKRLPNYITFKNKRVSPRLLTYDFAKVLVKFDKTGELQSEVIIANSVFNKPKSKYGHATKQGCDNMGQNNSHYCGPHSLQECVRNLTGKVIPQSKIASWAGTTTSGTDHQGLQTAVAKAAAYLGVKLEVKWVNFSELGWDGIRKIIASENQDCLIHNLYRKKWGHYETVNSISGDNVKVQNSLGYTCAKGCYCGYVENRSTNTFKSYINGISQKSVMIITRVG